MTSNPLTSEDLFRCRRVLDEALAADKLGSEQYRKRIRELVAATTMEELNAVTRDLVPQPGHTPSPGESQAGDEGHVIPVILSSASPGPQEPVSRAVQLPGPADPASSAPETPSEEEPVTRMVPLATSIEPDLEPSPPSPETPDEEPMTRVVRVPRPIEPVQLVQAEPESPAGAEATEPTTQLPDMFPGEPDYEGYAPSPDEDLSSGFDDFDDSDAPTQVLQGIREAFSQDDEPATAPPEPPQPVLPYSQNPVFTPADPAAGYTAAEPSQPETEPSPATLAAMPPPADPSVTVPPPQASWSMPGQDALASMPPPDPMSAMPSQSAMPPAGPHAVAPYFGAPQDFRAPQAAPAYSPYSDAPASAPYQQPVPLYQPPAQPYQPPAPSYQEAPAPQRRISPGTWIAVTLMVLALLAFISYLLISRAGSHAAPSPSVQAQSSGALMASQPTPTAASPSQAAASPSLPEGSMRLVDHGGRA